MKTITAVDISKPFSVAIVVSRFNEQVTRRLYEGVVQRLKELEIPSHDITVVWVPGAVEIPIIAQQLARANNYAAIIVLGAVIRGETGHYDFVCKQASDGCQLVALKYNIPVIFGILTTENLEQALDRAGGKHSHAGREAVDAAFEMVSILEQLRANCGAPLDSNQGPRDYE
jgi:6,7-dimethyl-8-ribityllumazine synthase